MSHPTPQFVATNGATVVPQLTLPPQMTQPGYSPLNTPRTPRPAPRRRWLWALVLVLMLGLAVWATRVTHQSPRGVGGGLVVQAALEWAHAFERVAFVPYALLAEADQCVTLGFVDLSAHLLWVVQARHPHFCAQAQQWLQQPLLPDGLLQYCVRFANTTDVPLYQECVKSALPGKLAHLAFMTLSMWLLA